jgi:hypothetical protein
MNENGRSHFNEGEGLLRIHFLEELETTVVNGSALHRLSLKRSVVRMTMKDDIDVEMIDRFRQAR